MSSLRKRSKGQDRVEPARPTRERRAPRRADRAGDVAELAELIDALLRALAELRIHVRIASAISVLLSGGKLLGVHLVRLQDTCLDRVPGLLEIRLGRYVLGFRVSLTRSA